MEDEFERIMSFFELSSEEKEARLQEVFEDSVEYFERFKHVMLNGSQEEKKAAVKKAPAKAKEAAPKKEAAKKASAKEKAAKKPAAKKTTKKKDA